MVRTTIIWITRLLFMPIFRRIIIPLVALLRGIIKELKEQLQKHAPWTSLWSPKRLALQTMVVAVALVGSRTTLFASDATTPTVDHSILSTILRPEPEPELIEDSTLPILQPAGSVETQNLTAVDPEILDLFVYDEETNNDGDTDLAIGTDDTGLESPVILPGNSNVVVPRRTGITEYTIKEGDTVSGIAQTFGVSITTILSENNLSAYSMIKPGQTLKILPFSGITYTIKKGDTLAGIAQKTKGDVEEIRTQNNLSTDKLIAGGTLIIPNGRAIAVAPASRIQPQTNKTALSIPSNLSASNIVGLVWPTVSRHINQYFGRRHTGVDIKGTTGTPIYAVEDGDVALAGWNRGGYGQQVVLKHDDGLLTRYAHMSKIIAKPGQSVKKGQVIGLVGSTGRSTGPHLHFEIIKRGARLNPLNAYK